MSDAAAFALRHPPTCIAEFAVTPVPGHHDDITARFSIVCKACNSSTLRILCFPITARDSKTYAGVSAGQVVERNPHHVVCVNCGKRDLLFDAEQHGYDGALGHGSTYDQGADDERPITCKKENYSVQVKFYYNIELSELQEIAAETKLTPEDLFDAISIYAVSLEGAELTCLDYECA